MWKDRQQLTPHRAWEMAATYVAGTVIAVIIVLTIGSMAHARWRPEYAQNTQQVRDWFSSQQLNPTTKQRLGVPWNGCCENGDVFKTQFRVSKNTGGDEWYYLKGDTWKKVPDDVIHWGQHSPDKRATLFIYVATGQELCFYPPEEGI
jgi:hypothetical protein